MFYFFSENLKYLVCILKINLFLTGFLFYLYSSVGQTFVVKKLEVFTFISETRF